MRHLICAALAAVACGATPVAGVAPQSRPVEVRRPASNLSVAWLGFRSAVTVQVDESGARITGSSLRVTDVFRDGPAERAGLRPGDLLVGFNGAPLAVERFQSLAQRLRPGDPMSLTVVRDGRETNVVLTAAPRPAVEDMVPIQLQRALDASRRTFVARLDSATVTLRATVDLPRLELGRIRADSIQSVQITGEDGTHRVAIRTTDGVFEWIAPQDGSAGPPRTFTAWVYRSEESDEPGNSVVVATGTGSRSNLPPRRLVEVAGPPSAPRPTVAAAAPRFPGSPVLTVRPLAPYLAGMNRVAGAEFTRLSGELATYFHVEGGLLVTDVAERTPAADTGLVPGDVIVEAGGRPIRSVDAFRAALSAREGPLTLTIVRRGMRVEVGLGG